MYFEPLDRSKNIVTKKNEFCVQQHLVVKKALFLVEATKKRQKIFFLNFDCLREKRCTRTFKRTFFEDRDAHVRSLIRHTFSMDFSKNCTTIISRACYNQIINEM